MFSLRAGMADVLPAAPATADGAILPLLLTVFTSILEVFILCLAGYILAWRGILDKRTIKHLNRLNIALFTPALLFSKVAAFLSPEKLKELWVIPIIFVVVTTVSMLVSFFLATIFGVTRPQRNFALAASMFMNSNSLPVALMQSLVVTIPALKWGPGDDSNAMVGRALTYLLLYSTLGMVLRWSVGWQLLTSVQGPSDPESVGAGPDADETSALVSPEFVSNGDTRRSVSDGRRFNWFPKSPNHSRAQLVRADSGSAMVPSPEEDDLEGDSEAAPLTLHAKPTPRTPRKGLKTRLTRAWARVARVWTVLNGFMTAPLWAALASILVACVPPLQHAFKEHMHPVKGALSSAGNCSIPTTLVVLGAYFYPPQPTPSDGAQEKPRRAAEAPAPHPGETKTVAIAVAARMLLTPLLLLPLMAVCAKYDFQAVFADPVFVVANILLVSSPPALTLAQISQAASGDAFERLISRTIFWAYCIVTPFTAVAYAVVGLRLSEL
ncbi:auxin efflux carrier [Mycena belliarum]|uniref:Auxin efflux carrier n=1 Tax=Mycena belliarum TaxID=1033014 RepID=A0AAD6TNX5_9AGAR|nr:auxin efflux carrier [Mycena belliae]